MPPQHKEAALALGATRWEMIRMAVLPYSRAGISGAAMLGLGRAIGETIAVTIVIGNAPNVAQSIFNQGYTLAAVIANEFGEAASDPTHRAALIAAGLVLFVLTLIVNAIARYYVNRAERGQRARCRGGWPDERTLRPRQRPPPHRPTACRAALTLALTVRRDPAARPDPLLPDQEGPRAPGAPTSSRPTRRAGSSATRAASSPPSSGTIEMVALASAIAIPFGIGVALYLVEYGKDSALRQRRALLRRRHDRRAVDRLRPLHLHRPRRHQDRRDVRRLEGLGRAGAAHAAGRHALGRGRAQPRARLACARPRWRSARRAGASSSAIVLPTALPGLVTGSLLAVARAAGETAPLLFTAAFVVQAHHVRPLASG